jgi:ABC-type Fe3+/spermidine/putrescine transport system ATPase subunit
MNLELRTVSKAYDGSLILKDLSLTIEAGESVAILGRSGSGKSTLLRLLAGLEPPTTGQVLVGGVLASDGGRVLVPPHRRGLSMVFQDLALWPNLTVLGNVHLGLSGLRLSRHETRSRALEALGQCAIQHLERRKPSQISGGEQQRVALARAIATSPAFLLLDEPFSGLDPVTKAQVAEVIAQAARGNTLVLVTHEPLDAVELCGKGVVLEEGCILEAGPWAELLRAPRSRLLGVFKERLRTVPQSGRPGTSA